MKYGAMPGLSYSIRDTFRGSPPLLLGQQPESRLITAFGNSGDSSEKPQDWDSKEVSYSGSQSSSIGLILFAVVEV